MNHILHYEEWQAATGWVCGDVSCLAKGSNYWWYIPALLEISYKEYIILLKDKFGAKHFHYKAKDNVLTFSFDTLESCRKFKNYINKIAREKRFYIY